MSVSVQISYIKYIHSTSLMLNGNRLESGLLPVLKRAKNLHWVFQSEEIGWDMEEKRKLK